MSAADENCVAQTLALAAGHVVTTNTLIDAVWGDDPPPSADKSLQSHMSRIRQQLPEGLIETAGHGYLLRVRPVDVDAHLLVHLVDRPSGHRPVATRTSPSNSSTKQSISGEGRRSTASPTGLPRRRDRQARSDP